MDCCYECNPTAAVRRHAPGNAVLLLLSRDSDWLDGLVLVYDKRKGFLSKI
jgi:hypothetical protein